MVNSKEILDFRKQINLQDTAFPMLQILDNNGKIVDEDGLKRAGLSDDELVQLFKNMLLSRQIDIRCMKLAKQGRMGFFGPTAGQEASQMASAFAFKEQDWLFPGYRDLPQIYSKGWPVWKGLLWSRGHQLGNEYTTDDGKPVNSWFPQIIIGAQYVEAAGVALGLKKKKQDAVAFVYTGDGGSSQGDTYEGLNFASSFKAPLVAFIQNNGYAISTPRKVQTAAQHLAAKGWAVGAPSIVVDGNDAIAMYLAAKEARAWAVAGNGPVVIETITDRLEPHSTAGDDPLRYRTQAEIDSWWKKEPLIRMRKFLTCKKLWDEKKENDYIAELDAMIDENVKKANGVEKQKISSFIKNTLEVPGQVMTEQIKKFESEGK
ncbi:MAG: thiamine pyrophosphate-dependent dehydrogenase E1 component subunit alpha [Streptococcaceae bacterium]|jgi:pyruvate dehydrogenase E1 component alpha subunit|nr:thiamine pyrophosphate-dependent dehydrogenase E1 component subunit alpha [Streptococcaceae bacterium]